MIVEDNVLFTIDPDKEFAPTIDAFNKLPKARRMVKAIQNELKAKQRSILERYDLLKQNGRSDEKNATELKELQQEAAKAEEKALEAVKALQVNAVLALQDQVAEMEEKCDRLEKQCNKAVKERRAELTKADKEKAVKIYPNDPCPCGSGKKYKKCCGG